MKSLPLLSIVTRPSWLVVLIRSSVSLTTGCLFTLLFTQICLQSLSVHWCISSSGSVGFDFIYLEIIYEIHADLQLCFAADVTL